ncbi:MAG: hypothetical protein AAFP90_14415 [Planctomycetota bacterium]
MPENPYQPSPSPVDDTPTSRRSSGSALAVGFVVVGFILLFVICCGGISLMGFSRVAVVNGAVGAFPTSGNTQFKSPKDPRPMAESTLFQDPDFVERIGSEVSISSESHAQSERSSGAGEMVASDFYTAQLKGEKGEGELRVSFGPDGTASTVVLVMDDEAISLDAQAFNEEIRKSQIDALAPEMSAEDVDGP